MMMKIMIIAMINVYETNSNSDTGNPGANAGKTQIQKTDTNDVKGKGGGDHHIIISLIRDNCRLSL